MDANSEVIEKATFRVLRYTRFYEENEDPGGGIVLGTFTVRLIRSNYEAMKRRIEAHAESKWPEYANELWAKPMGEYW